MKVPWCPAVLQLWSWLEASCSSIGVQMKSSEKCHAHDPSARAYLQGCCRAQILPVMSCQLTFANLSVEDPGIDALHALLLLQHPTLTESEARPSNAGRSAKACMKAMAGG